MADRRELILVRLHELVSAVSGVVTAVRNRIEFDDTQLPAIAVLEGDEEVEPVASGPRGGPSLRPYVVTMTPQIYIRDASRTGIGTSLNTLRIAVIETVLSDPALNELTFHGRSVRPAGMQSNLHAGRQMLGAHALVFSIAYLLDPRDF